MPTKGNDSQSGIGGNQLIKDVIKQGEPQKQVHSATGFDAAKKPTTIPSGNIKSKK